MASGFGSRLSKTIQTVPVGLIGRLCCELRRFLPAPLRRHRVQRVRRPIVRPVASARRSSTTNTDVRSINRKQNPVKSSCMTNTVGHPVPPAPAASKRSPVPDRFNPPSPGIAAESSAGPRHPRFVESDHESVVELLSHCPRGTKTKRLSERVIFRAGWCSVGKIDANFRGWAIAHWLG